MAGVVGAVHHFEDDAYAKDWAFRFTATPGRLELFDTIINGLQKEGLASPLIVELGIGPGFFAERLLSAVERFTLLGVDNSRPMLDMCRERLSPFGERTLLMQADISAPGWEGAIPGQVGAVVTTWALHDLGGEAATLAVYKAARALLKRGGLFFNGDFVRPEGAAVEFEPGRFTVERHLKLLGIAGFEEAESLGYWERELVNPLPSQNYTCFKAVSRITEP